MRQWHIHLLGIRDFRGALSTFEVQHFFSLTDRELAAVKSRRGARQRLAIAIQIGFIKMSGRTLDGFGRLRG